MLPRAYGRFSKAVDLTATVNDGVVSLLGMQEANQLKRHALPALRRSKRASTGMSSAGVIVGVIVSLPVVVILLGAIFGGVGFDQRPSLTARVNFYGGVIGIMNSDAFDWSDCDIELNDDFKRHAARIGAGDFFEARAESFVRADGARFNPKAAIPVRLYIYCRQAPTAARSSLHGWEAIRNTTGAHHQSNF